MSDDIVVVIDEGIPAKVVEVGIQGPMGPPGTEETMSRITLGPVGQTVLVWDAPANSAIRMIEVQVKVPYNDPYAVLTIGTDADPSLLPAINKLQGSGVYQNVMNAEITTATQIKAFLSSAATVGGCSVILNFISK